MKLVNAHILKTFLGVLILFSFNISNAQTYSLQQCIDTALVNNKKLQISRNNQQIAEQKNKEVKSNLLPKLDANAEYKYYPDLPYQLMPLSTFNPMAPEGQFKEAQFGVPHNINANLQLSVPLYNAQLYSNIATTKITNQLADLQKQKTGEQVFFEVSNLYYNLQILANQQVFIDSNLQNTSKLLNNMKLLHSQLLAKATDVSKVELQQLQLQTQKQLLDSKFEQVLNTLKLFMGIEQNREVQIEKNIQMKEQLENSANNNIDMLLAQQRINLVESELKSIKRSRIPSLALFGMYGTTGFGYDKQPNDFLNFYPISFAGIRLQYPLFNGLATQRKVNQKKIELTNVSLEAEWLKDQTNLQTTNATNEKIISFQSVKNAEKQLALAEKVYTQTLFQLKEGTASLTEVLLADNTFRESQQNYLAAVIAYFKADLELKKLTGNLTIKN